MGGVSDFSVKSEPISHKHPESPPARPPTTTTKFRLPIDNSETPPQNARTFFQNTPNTMTTDDTMYLRDNGPATRQELPTMEFTLRDRMDGIWRFNPSLGRRIDPTNSETPVFYLPDEHEPLAVLKAWGSANHDHLADFAFRQWTRVIRDHNPEWGEVSKTAWHEHVKYFG